LAKAWAFYEHVTLPRRYTGENIADTVINRAEPGEQAETELYDPFFTPQSALIEWGTGVDLYFISLKFFAGVLFIAGLINIVSIRYFESDTYIGEEAHNATELILQGSAVCTNTAWVVCEDCRSDEWSLDKNRFAMASDGTILVLRNLCHGAAAVNGITNFFTLLFLLVSFFIFSYYLRLREIRFDEDNVTSSDYSLMVDNPPRDALDPDEWREFFEQFTPDDDHAVTVVTVALNNEELVGKLIKRRVLQRKLRLKLPEDIDLDDDLAVHAEIEQINVELEEDRSTFLVRLCGCFCAKSPDTVVTTIEALTEEIKVLQTKNYNATKVFVTFETEVAQRAALKALTVGKLDIYREKTSRVAPEHVFRGKLLKVNEPCEPNAVRWLDLSVGTMEKVKGRLLTFGLTCGILAIASVGITRARSSMGPSLSGPLTSVSNVIIPHVIKFLMGLESHATEGGYQTSLYMKVTLFRWTLSAILAQVCAR
jgi:hypothetical protein